MSARKSNAERGPRPLARAALLCTLATVAGSALAAEYGTVVSSTPINVQVPVPQTQCTDRQQLVQPAPSGGGAVLGALIGGAVGNGVGGGFGRAVATGVGVVAGAAIGNQVEANANPPVATTVRQCNTVTAYETRVIGYDVVYDYNGQRYSTRLAQAPGERIALNVAVTAEGATAPGPGQAPVQTVAPAPVAVVQPAPAVYGYPAYYGYDGYHDQYGPSVAVVPQMVIWGYWGRGGHGRWH